MWYREIPHTDSKNCCWSTWALPVEVVESEDNIKEL